MINFPSVLIFPIYINKKNKVTGGYGAQIGMRHPEMVHLYNYSATTIAGNIRYYTSEMIKDSFKSAFPGEIKAGYLKKVKAFEPATVNA